MTDFKSPNSFQDQGFAELPSSKTSRTEAGRKTIINHQFLMILEK